MQSVIVGVIARSPVKPVHRRTMYKAVQGFVRLTSATSRFARIMEAIGAQGYPNIESIMRGAAANVEPAGRHT